jgi:hypothetical protein
MLDVKVNRRRFSRYLNGQTMRIGPLDSPLEIAHDMAIASPVLRPGHALSVNFAGLEW